MKRYLLSLIFIAFNYISFAQQPTSPDLYVVKQNNKYGYIDSTGKIMIQPQFDYADDFVEGLAKVGTLSSSPIDFNFGIISPSQKWIIPPIYERLTIQTNKVIIARKDSVYYIFNEQGKLLSKFKTPSISFANKYIAIVNKGGDYLLKGGETYLNGSWGIYKLNGQEIVPPILSNLGVTTYYKNVIIYSDSARNTGVMNLKGHILSPNKFFNIHPIKNTNLLAFQEKNFSWGIINKRGKILVPPIYSIIDDIANERLIGVMHGHSSHSKIGFINQKGKLAIDTIYNSASGFSENLCAVRKDNKWGYINTKGEIVIPFQYSKAKNFNEGRAAVSVATNKSYTEEDYYFSKDKWGVIDTKGTYIVSPTYQNIVDYSNGVAAVQKDGFYSNTFTDNFDSPYEFGSAGKWGLIDLNGKIVIEPNYGSIYAKHYPLILINDSCDHTIHGMGWECSRDGVIDIRENWIVPYQNDSSYIDIQRNLIKVKETTKNPYCYVVDRMLNKVDSTLSVEYEPTRSSLPSFDENNYAYTAIGLSQMKNGKLTDANSDLVLYARYDEAIQLAYKTKKQTLYNRPVYSTKYFGVDKERNIVFELSSALSKKIEALYLHGAFSEGLCWIKTSYDSCVYINVKGEIVAHLPYSEAGDFCNGFTKVKKGNKFIILDRFFTPVSENQFNDLGNFDKNGLAKFKNEDGLYGFLDTTAKIIIPAVFHSTTEFNVDGYSIVAQKQDGKYLMGIINTKGEYLFNLQSNYTLELISNNLIKAGKHMDKSTSLKYGYIDFNGNIVIPFSYKEISNFKNGYVIGNRGGYANYEYELLNDRGEIVKKDYFYDVNIYGEGDYLFAIPLERTKTGIGYYNSSGQCVWPVQY